MVGYAPDHAGECYEMWDESTSDVHKTSDVTWLKRMFYEPAAKPNVILDIEVEEGAEEEPEPVPVPTAAVAEVQEIMKQLSNWAEWWKTAAESQG